MYRLLTTIIFFLAAHGAGAQCVAAAAPAAPVVAHARPAAELIKTAAAGTTDGAAPEATATATKSPASGDERHRPSGRAMLFAVIALMSGIALRRASASQE